MIEVQLRATCGNCDKKSKPYWGKREGDFFTLPKNWRYMIKLRSFKTPSGHIHDQRVEERCLACGPCVKKLCNEGRWILGI